MSLIEKDSILIIDDDPFSAVLVSEFLATKYQVSIANDAEEGLAQASSLTPPDLILLDIEMPNIDGYETCRRLKANAKTRDIPIVFLTVKNDSVNEAYGLELGAVDYIHKPISSPILMARIKSQLLLKNAQKALEVENLKLEERVAIRTNELSVTQDAAILALISLVETRHEETGNHIMRTREYIQVLALELRTDTKYRDQLDDEFIEALYKSAPLHDIGKVGVPDHILKKPGKLTPDEFEEIKKHSIYGMNALKQSEEVLGSNSFLRTAKDIAYTHHEKWDGSGYPRGIKKEEIPLSGRLMSVADCYDAIRCRRIYKTPRTHREACDFIISASGTQFDPGIVQAFQQVSSQFDVIATRFGIESETEVSRPHPVPDAQLA